MDQLLENMIESLTCYNCQAIPGKNKDKRFSCHKNSHQLCETCSKSKCNCGSSVMKCPNLVVEKLLEDLPIFCQNYRKKCRQIFQELKDLEEHEKTCGILYCQNKIRKCQQQFFEVEELEDHQKKCDFRKILNCQNKIRKCQQKFLELEELENHQKKCDYRLIICPSNKCQNENNGAYAAVQFRYWDEHCLYKRHKRTRSECWATANGMMYLANDNSILPKQPMKIFLRLPRALDLARAAFPVMKYETLFEFFKLPNDVELCLIGEVVNDIVKFWMCINGLPSEAQRYSYTISYKGYGQEDNFISNDYQVFTLEENPLDIITNKPVFTAGLNILELNKWKERVGFVITIFDLEKPKKTLWQKLKKNLTT